MMTCDRGGLDQKSHNPIMKVIGYKEILANEPGVSIPGSFIVKSKRAAPWLGRMHYLVLFRVKCKEVTWKT